MFQTSNNKSCTREIKVPSDSGSVTLSGASETDWSVLPSVFVGLNLCYCPPLTKGIAMNTYGIFYIYERNEKARCSVLISKSTGPHCAVKNTWAVICRRHWERKQLGDF